MPIQKINLLLVDDDDQIRELLSIILTHSGYRVRSAQDGFSALAAMREEMPDILLSDLYMPGMSGFELLSVVRRRFPRLPVIAMSSAYSGDAVPDGVAADAFYEKATDLHELLAKVNAIQEHPQTGLELRRRPAVPVWVARSGTSTGKRPHVILACPECLRTFSETISEVKSVICEAGCVHCSTPMMYALVGVDYTPKSMGRPGPKLVAKAIAA